MGREIINSKRVTPYRHPMSHAVRTRDLVFLSGITPFKGNRELAVGDFTTQMHQVMHNVRAILEDAGSSLDLAVKMTIVMTSMTNFKEMNEIFSGYFQADNYPARLTLQSELPGKDFLVQIDCVAELNVGLPNSSPRE